MGGSEVPPFHVYPETPMLHHSNVSAFTNGTVRVGETLPAAEALWIEPYTAIGVSSPITGGIDVFASFDGETYLLCIPGVLVEAGFLRSWKARIPARWLKFVGKTVGQAAAIPDGTMLSWGAKS